MKKLKIKKKKRVREWLIKYRKIIIFLTISAVVLSTFFSYHYYLSYKNISGISIQNDDEVIEVVKTCLKKHSWQIRLELTIHTNKTEYVDEMVEQLMESAVKETDSPTEGDYLRYQYGGYQVKYEYKEKYGNRFHYVVKIIPNYYTTLKQEEFVNESVAAILEGFGFDENTSDYEKVKKIYDYVYRTVSYDKVHKYNENNHMKTTAYAALKYKTAVCQGYAVLMYRLLKEAGIKSRVITGNVMEDGTEQLHAWNIVEIDGRYYNLDVTWNKALETEEYFLKCDENFENHMRGEAFMTEEFYREYPMAESDYYQ